MLINLRNENTGETYNKPLSKVSALRGVVTTTRQPQRNIFHIADLFDYLMNDHNVSAMILPQTPDEVKWLIIEREAIDMLCRWAGSDVLQAFENVEAAGQPAQNPFRWLRRSTEHRKDDADLRARLISAYISRRAPVPRPASASALVSGEPKRRRVSVGGGETETETEADSDQEENTTRTGTKTRTKTTKARAGVRARARARARASQTQTQTQTQGDGGSESDQPLSDEEAANVLTSFKEMCNQRRPSPLKLAQDIEPRLSRDLSFLSPRVPPLTNQLRTIMCMALLPWSPVSVSIPVLDGNNKMVGLLAPLSWLNFMTRRLSKEMAAGEDRIDKPTLEYILGTELPDEDVELASQLVQDILRPVLSAHSEVQVETHLTPAVLIREHTFQRMFGWYRHPGFEVNKTNLCRSKSVWVANSVDFSIKLSLPDEPTLRFYLASAYTRLHCRVTRSCSWRDLPAELGRKACRLSAMFWDMLVMFVSRIEDRQKLMKMFIDEREFQEKFAQLEIIRV